MTPLFLLLWACAPADSDPNEGGPGTDPTNPTQPGTQPFEPVPMGVDYVEPDTVDVMVDSVGADCSGTTATVQVDTLGHADVVELDLVHDAGIHTVTLDRSPIESTDVWVSFTGDAPCDLVQTGTWVIRASRDGTEADCAVHGSGRAEVLAGNADASLSDAGRPAIAGCHDIAG